ncbi:MAG: glucuronate isomerase [Kineosporiaceae bacterium]
MTAPWRLDPDRLFDPEPSRRVAARELYAAVSGLPLVCPHGHVPPALLADPDARFGSPADLFVIPDHYVVRMLSSRGVDMAALGVPTRDGTPVETDHRAVWRRFCEHFALFRGTPSGLWLTTELIDVFGVTEKPSADSADRLYDHLCERLADPAYSPRALYDRFGIEVLCTTDAATDDLAGHAAIAADPWGGRVLPTFRPDAVLALGAPGWRDEVARLSGASGVDVVDHGSFVAALEQRREHFRRLGAVATDHAAPTPRAEPLDDPGAVFARALAGRPEPGDAEAYAAHMLLEMARMSADDGLVMQLHAGSLRDHHPAVHRRFGPDRGADIPVATEWTRNLRPLLAAHGADPRFRLVVFGLDESTYSRELAPLAGHYPSLVLGPPWWFLDSPLGIRRYLDGVVETAGVANLAGFNDDTRAFASIPARHDVWRRVVADWAAGLLVTGVVDADDAHAMVRRLAYDAARETYRLDGCT